MTRRPAFPTAPLLPVLLALAGCVASGPASDPPYEPTASQGQAGAGAIGDANADAVSPSAASDPTELETDAVDLDAAPEADELLAEATPVSVELPPDFVIPKRVVGEDTRRPVSDTRAWPYSSVVMLLVTFPGATGMCSGSLIARDAVLTAAHCVYDVKNQAWASNVRVIPGAYAGSDGQGRPRLMQPFGSASGKKLFAPSAYRSGKDFWAREPHDYAVIRFGSGLRNEPGTRALGVMAEPSVGVPVTLVAYHGDKCVDGDGDGKCASKADVRTQQQSGDSVRELLVPPGFATARLFNHYADSGAGSSGGPLVSRSGFADTIFAIHIAGFSPARPSIWNMGLLLTDANLQAIQGWAYAEY